MPGSLSGSVGVLIPASQYNVLSFHQVVFSLESGSNFSSDGPGSVKLKWHAPFCLCVLLCALLERIHTFHVILTKICDTEKYKYHCTQ